MNPFMRAMAEELKSVGGKVLAAGVERALEEVGKLTEEADRRVKKGAKRAGSIARGRAGEDD